MIMTREGEIEQQAFVYYESCSDEDIAKSKGFIEGAKWADKTMIEKVLNFINTYFYDHPHVNIHVCTDFFESLEQMQEELIKAMKE